MIEADVDPLADEGTVVGGRKRTLVVEVAIARLNALAVPRIDRDAAPAHRADGRRGQRLQTLGHFADNAGAGGPSFPVDGNHVNAADPLAHESDIVLAHHSAGGQAIAGVDDEADQLALLDEASRHVLFDRCNEHAGARTGDDEVPAALAGTLEVGHHAVDLLLQNPRLGLLGRAHSRVLAQQPSQLSLQHLDASVEEGIISFYKRLPGLNLRTICAEKTSNEAVRPAPELGALGGPRHPSSPLP